MNRLKLETILDPVSKLALTISENRGVYALLLGSGISKSANIPTGWDIVTDLIRKIARLNKENADPNPEEWYRQKFGEPPDYSKLLDQVAAAPSERAGIIRSYFEPNESEREEGMKMPTQAHKAIAKLVKRGYIRMILTTNFDRLQETALGDEGIVPDIIDCEDALNGAIPHIHSNCYLVKLNGDYRDHRIKNTKKELASYPKKLNDLLDRVLDEFGLIICGWSGEWDMALQSAILRSPVRRFSTFWLNRTDLSQEAQNIVRARKAHLVPIESADHFFMDLLEKVDSIEEWKRPDPISTDLAIESVKRYVADFNARIKLQDLIRKETEKAFESVQIILASSNEFPTKELFQEQMKRYEAAVERLLAVIATLSYYDTGQNADLFKETIERLIGIKSRDGYLGWNKLRLYPAMLLVYAAGVGAVATKRPKNLAMVLNEPAYREHPTGKKIQASSILNWWGVFDDSNLKFLPVPNAEETTAAVSEYLVKIFWPIYQRYVPDYEKFQDAFDLFEFVLNLTYMHSENYEKAPVGRYVRRWRGVWERSPMEDFIKGKSHDFHYQHLVESGFFGGSDGRFFELVKNFKDWAGPIFRLFSQGR